ncbi:MAG: hypothetical protein A2Z34_07625 [Planctomycetes bacterium RBG_16_59_8]|nr:MAG: hypothetical protein A2Z34_07625 [Planctomycetes bacterium RBG_16_59_8]
MIKKTIIPPSLLAADFSRLAEETAKVEEGGADWIHIDVMDGHFVPNITVGPVVVEWLKKTTRLPLDVHLMIEDPLRYAGNFLDAGADILTFHAEAIALPGARRQTEKGAMLPPGSRLDNDRLERISRLIRGRGAKAGIALNPETGADILRDAVKSVDMVLAMTVWPGFGGQRYIDDVTAKIAQIRALAPEMEIEVDGGLTPETLPAAARAGANVIVAGTATFRSGNPTKAIRQLREAALAGSEIQNPKL